MATPIRVLCVDDDRDILDLLYFSLAIEPDMEVVGSLTNADTLLSEVETVVPDIVLLDLTMPGKDASVAIKEVLAAMPGTRIIVHSGITEPDLITQLFGLGACGYVRKGLPRLRLVEVIRNVVSGMRDCVAA